MTRTGADLTTLPPNVQVFLKEYEALKAPTNLLLGTLNGADQVSLATPRQAEGAGFVCTG